MPRPTWTGRRTQAATRYVIQRDKGICWICQQPEANSLDHIIPASIRPDLEWEPTNWKAAHLETRTNETHGYQCIGNRKRKAQLINQPTTRQW